MSEETQKKETAMQIKNEQNDEKPDYTDEKPKQTQKTSKSKEPYRDHSRERHNEIVALLNDIKNILSEINEHQKKEYPALHQRYIS